MKFNSSFVSALGLTLGLALSANVMLAQKKDPVLMTVGGDQVTKSEFLNIYQKNNNKGQQIDNQDLQDYLELFIKFKLKVMEAKALGMDTTPEFQSELAGYRKDLAKPYLSDKATIESLVQEAYERSKTDIRASHILIIVERDASPEDTLKAWNKIMEVHQRCLNGEPFASLAEMYSEDPSARPSKARGGQTTMPGNGGDLGYFTALDMVYPFEAGAYNASKGMVSMPVRTDFGYHLILVNDIKPAMGQAIIAHIHVSVSPEADATQTAEAKQRIDQIYNQIQDGLSFEEAAARYSDDKSSATKNGLLPEFGVNRMVPEIIEAISHLSDTGMISPPVKTSYGWHIVKLIHRQAPGDFKSMESQLRAKVQRDGRASLGRAHTAAQVQKEYGFKEYPKALEAFKLVVDSNLLTSSWSVPENAKLTMPLFKIGKTKVTQQEFADFIAQNQRRYRVKHINGFVDIMYHQFVEQECIDYLDQRLEGKYPEFRLLVREYHDGILLFNLMDERVWSKAVRDTTGLREFYESRSDSYRWDERVEAIVYRCASPAVASQVKSLLEAGDATDTIMSKVNKENPLNLSVQKGLFEKGDNKYVDQVEWRKGISPDFRDNGLTIFVQILSLHSSEPKSLKEAKGLVTADYQEFLEKTWLEELRAKFPVIVNQKVLDSIK